MEGILNKVRSVCATENEGGLEMNETKKLENGKELQYVCTRTCTCVYIQTGKEETERKTVHSQYSRPSLKQLKQRYRAHRSYNDVRRLQVL